ncbi:Export ABC transporter permease protein [Moritella viscosa]|uniref:Export ABC transporter permease protein n=1 Tax=Moritella viscosa TaxID=80854 RepID=A0A090KAE0_9GAMM|nr:ABC transporter permease [Moritella viscosa]CED60823.1 putative ABC transporter, permease component [Moritella viscosa]SGZ08679.1 Export ABC transporter permease protein [Moritella viscosa]SHO10594.1 Export ABC transporter permease protein [Moritella viscosa]SHO10597.1 Export ABC transporter permease protein [Moritella viscosa]SHO11589.1 Export ABC transporter permease protein [Moritella viscosa]
MTGLLSQTIQTLLAHRLRSLLAVIAIVWGVISVLVLVALGEGFYQTNTKSFALLMSDTQMAFPGQTTKAWQGLPVRRNVSPSESDMREISRQSGVRDISVVYGKWDARVTDSRGRSLPGYVRGIDNQFFELQNQKLVKKSRKINRNDLDNHNRVAVVGWQLADIGNLNVGGTLNVNGIPFVVIGVTEKNESGISFNNAESQAMIPSSTFNDLWKSKPTMLLVSPANAISGVMLRKSLLSFFAKQQHFDPSDKDSIYMPDLGREAIFFKTLLRGIQLFLGASGAMTLAVGSLGVANIMFLSVTERTREIGVRLAIGATPNNILGQFLAEGVILVACGTVIGIISSYAIVALLNYIGMPEWLGFPMITLEAVWMSLGVITVLALFASYFPARRASNLIPVIALNARA